MVKSSDQRLDFVQNKALVNSRTNGIEAHLFEVLIQKEYIYQGRVTFVRKTYQEVQNDDDEIQRKVWRIPLKLNNESKPILEEVLKISINIKEKAA